MIGGEFSRMSFLKFLRGKRQNIPETKTDGTIYVCTDDGTAHFDYIDDEGIVQRKSIMAGNYEDLLLKTPQELTAEEIEQVRQNIHSAGIMTSGLERAPFTVTEVRGYDDWDAEFGEPVVCAQGAEIYNDYVHNIASGMWARASGAATQALGDFSDASGWLTKATNFCAIASGRGTIASGPYSHAEGMNSQALKNDSHAEGESCIANGARAHAEGYFTQANHNQAHSEGMNTIASGVNSHAEGWGTTASGQNAFSGGKNTLASGANSTARGLGTIAAGSQQFVNGKYNVSDTTSLIIVGNGASDTDRSNAYTLDSKGNAWFSGNIYVGGTKQSEAARIYTQAEVDSLLNDAIEWGSF